jgi:hypothetical protein
LGEFVRYLLEHQTLGTATDHEDAAADVLA